MHKLVEYISKEDVKNGVITIKVPGPYQIDYVNTERVKCYRNIIEDRDRQNKEHKELVNLFQSHPMFEKY